MRKILIEFAIDVIQQFGYRSGKRPYYWAGGLSTLEAALGILYRLGVSRSSDKIFEYEIKRYWEKPELFS